MRQLKFFVRGIQPSYSVPSIPPGGVQWWIYALPYIGSKCFATTVTCLLFLTLLPKQGALRIRKASIMQASLHFFFLSKSLAIIQIIYVGLLPAYTSSMLGSGKQAQDHIQNETVTNKKNQTYSYKLEAIICAVILHLFARAENSLKAMYMWVRRWSDKFFLFLK